MDSKQRLTLFIYMATALVVSFLLGRMFGISIEVESSQTEPPRVYIEQQKTQLKIETSDPNIEIYVDGSKIDTEE